MTRGFEPGAFPETDFSLSEGGGVVHSTVLEPLTNVPLAQASLLIIQSIQSNVWTPVYVGYMIRSRDRKKKAFHCIPAVL